LSSRADKEPTTPRTVSDALAFRAGEKKPESQHETCSDAALEAETASAGLPRDNVNEDLSGERLSKVAHDTPPAGSARRLPAEPVSVLPERFEIED
jgi:hypothetical protein